MPSKQIVAVALWTMLLARPTLAQQVAAPLGPPAPQRVARTQSRPFSLAEPPADEGAQPKVEAGLVEYLAIRFSAHEPIYYIYGALEPNTKFQISLKYQLMAETASLSVDHPWLSDFYLAYTQTSFWDVGGESSPFFDTSYHPEFLYQHEIKRSDWPLGISRCHLRAALSHESNGKSGADSRSMNIAHVSPILTFGDPGGRDTRGFFVAVAPRLWCYLGDQEENEDIADYRGYGDLRLVTGWRGGFQVAAFVRMGNDWDKGSLELDVSYPLRAASKDNIDLYLYGQLFTGYGETLLKYDEDDTTFRIGVALVR